MKGIYRFMVLALIGFTLGAGVAYWQATSRHVEPVAVDAQEQAAADAAINAGAADVVAAAPQDSAASSATEMAAADDHVAHDAHAGHDHAAMMPVRESATATTTDAVAGSAVGGAFALTDHNGQAVTHESWPGKYKLVFFGFTHCPDICPAALDRMTSALETLGDKTQQIQPLFITIDPARDDAATMKAYLGNYHAAILGLTGSDAQIKQVEDVYKVYAAKVDNDAPVYTMAHSSFIFLMTPDDQLLDIFRDADPADQMAAKIAERLGNAQP